MSTEILIIDDNADIRLILNELISDAGYKTRVAANYNQALSEIDKKLPDLAIIDVKLYKGDNDCIELLNHIKKKNKDIPVIIISGHANIKINLKLNGIKNMKLVCDYEQISRVIFNLIKNSIESIQEKSLKTKVFDKIINIEIKAIRDYIIIEIIDNGLGFPIEETKELIKPYYTTKQKGTGLGLSIVNKILSDHNGSINFNSQENGAKVQINLPLNNVN